ncbi:MAG TPA: NAD(P)-dependent oxidoreductase [Peptococcaceae bacterium]|nr:NAD(P)-dependent oxidoreductase [Peptococcaceae bacterium]
MLKLGFLGFGEVGYTFAKGILEKGAVCRVYAHDLCQNDGWKGEQIRARALETKVVLTDSVEDLVKISDIILGIVPSKASTSAAQCIAQYLTAGQAYCDLSSASPNVKKEAAHILKSCKGTFVDGAIMGAMATYGFQVPIFVAGEKAEEVAEKLKTVGFNLTYTGPEPGNASAVKMLRASFTKGIEALIVETFYAASRYGSQEMLLEVLADTFDRESFKETVNRYITSDAIHAGRRADEVSGVIEFLKQSDIEPFMATGTYQRLKWSESLGLKEKLKGVTPQDFREVLRLYPQKDSN